MYLIIGKVDGYIEEKHGKKGEYGKDFMKTKFDANDNLPLKKHTLHMLTIIVRSVLEEDSKFYRKLYLDDCLYEL